MSSKNLRERQEIPDHYKWATERLFSSPEACKEEIEAILKLLPTMESYRKAATESADGLLAAFRISETMGRRLRLVYTYASIRNAEDRGNPAFSSLQSQAMTLAGRASGAISFLEPTVLSIEEEKLEAWFNEQPGLRLYKHYIDDLIRSRAHFGSREEERLLGMVSSPFSGARNLLETLRESEISFRPAISESGEKISVSESSLEGILGGPDRSARRTAWESFADGHLAFKSTFATGLQTLFKQNIFRARARSFSSSLEASLFGENVPESVYRNLLEVFQASLPAWRRYWRLRRKVLGLETLHTYDIWCPLTRNRPRLSFEAVVDLICETLQPMGPEYVDTLRKGCLEERWVDVYPHRNKAAGAFCGGAPGASPYILTNFHEDVSGLSTLAHELGHAMSSHLTWQRQTDIYSYPHRFWVELPSNFHQMLLASHLNRAGTDRALKIAALEEAMERYHRYLFLMPTLAVFELELHEKLEQGKAMSADDMNGRLAELFARGAGDEMVIDRERDGISWSQYPHLYYPFYAYQYVVGIAGARALSRRVLEGGPSELHDYLELISTGSSSYPLDALERAGVDFTDSRVFQDAFALVDETVAELEKELG